MEFLKCPNCGCEYFREECRSITSQKDIRINIYGTADYDEAGRVEIFDDELIGYFCQSCGKEFIKGE